MTVSRHASILPAVILMLATLVAINGCSRAKHRIAADREAYEVIAERNGDPRWHADDVRIDPDRRSRFFDPFDPDCSPMPLDDPASQQYMRVVAGRKGWKHWLDNGERIDLENPIWRAALADYVEVVADGSVKLNVDSALKIAYINSSSNQTQLESLYLSALDVTAERFRLDTQFFGGYDLRYAHNGTMIPPALRYSPFLGRFVVNPAFEGSGIENNRLTAGRPFGANPALQARRKFATAGEFLVGFANSFVLEFTGSDASLASSLANFSLVQPLLRGAGRDIALEQLTNTERDLLANLRAYHQYRQGFYTQVAIGELGVTGPERRGGDTILTSFSGQGGVGGYIGLLQKLQQIRNSEDNLSLQLRTLAQLEALLDVGVIDLVQVDQFRQNVENERARLLQSRNTLELALDRYKARTLGMPPDLRVELDDSLIRQFQLVRREATAVQDSITQLQDRLGALPDNANVAAVGGMLSNAQQLVEPARRQLDDARADLERMAKALARREAAMNVSDHEQLRHDQQQLVQTLAELGQKLQQDASELERLRAGLAEPTRLATQRKLVVWLGDILRLVQRSILVQARARLEAVSVDRIELDPEVAFKIALENRLDFMNGRAALVDSWRQLQFNADALQSVVNLTASGELRTARNNAISFRAPTGNLRLGLEFDAPFTRLLERNSYRESIISFQQNRRNYIQSRDTLYLGIRALLRQLTQHRETLEIQRRAVAIAIRRVDLTRAELYAPVPPPRPGQRAAQFGPTAAFNLLSAQSALRDTQNSFMSVWLNYYATKMRLARELGIMLLDDDGAWLQNPLPGARGDGATQEQLSMPEELPVPTVLSPWFTTMEFPRSVPNGRPAFGAPTAGPALFGPAAMGPAPPVIQTATRPDMPSHPNVPMRRLPATQEALDTNGRQWLR